MFSLISRSEYDSLVSQYPSWMASVWPKIVGRWYLYGPNFNDRFHKRIMFLLSNR